VRGGQPGGDLNDTAHAVGAHTADGAAPVRVRPPGEEEFRFTRAQEGQNFDVHRNDLENGDRETLLTVRIALDTSRLDAGDPETVTRFGELLQRVQDDVDRVYNQGQRLPDGDLLRLRIEFVDPADDPHTVVAVHPEGHEEDFRNWNLDTTGPTLAHELGHHLGLPDEYRNHLASRRPVHADGGLMGMDKTNQDGRILPETHNWDDEHLVEHDRAHLQPRNLRHLASVIDRARQRDGRPTGAPQHHPYEDLPTRATFRHDARQTALHGPGGNGNGHLAPPLGAARPRPVPVPGTRNANGTYRAETPAPDGGRRRAG
ncbi:hypothetical protein ACFV6F_03270, partial [Kitasatospora phosalacinea]|uniref:hypothetical protein n=1 Tax=Kitasatospora phosalacinea TaxID=2065 RepID=UPI0036622CCD